jgi:hypothetical protein
MTEPTKTRRSRKMARPAAEPTDTAKVRPGVTSDRTKSETTHGSAKLAASPPPSEPKLVSKAAQVLALLQRSEGASLAQLVEATGWLPHTTRAALAGIRKKRQALSSEKIDGVRIYRISPAGATQ